MSWENTLRKAMELPPAKQKGEEDTPERNQQINDWADAYVNDVIRQFKERAQSAGQEYDYSKFGYIHFTSPDKLKFQYRDNFPEMTYGQAANLIKNFMKDLEYGTSGQRYNYQNEMKRMAKIPNKVVATLQSNSSYISEFRSFLRTQGY